jgi:P27 family predicted phage terminase small subunit
MPERKPKPKGLKEIAASQHKSLSDPKETKPSRILECPAELSPLARQEWNRMIAELMPMCVLSSVDRGPLAAYCVAYALWIEATDMLQKHGAMIKSPNGYPQQSPFLAVANKQLENMLRIACEFGFTPASRSRIFSFTQKNSMLLDAVDEPDTGLASW